MKGAAVFQAFYDGIQQDAQLALIAPIFCALFRLAFILAERSKKTPFGEWKKWYHCFRYGFWWGMDLNAYLFLVMVLFVSLPAAFLPAYRAAGDSVRLVLAGIYALALYLAFFGKMIFYAHFHDIFNDTVRLGQKAEKHNLLDIFLHQHHGVWILLGFLPYFIFYFGAGSLLLAIPNLPYPQLSSGFFQLAMNVGIILFVTLAFYFVRYGGSLNHRNKPEWDEIPPVVKKDIFMARATVDDLEALKEVFRRPENELLSRTDEMDAAAIHCISPSRVSWYPSELPEAAFQRTAAGAKIAKPSRIFFIVVESYSEMPLDPLYADYHIMDGAKAFRADPHTVSLSHFLPAGMVSRPAIVGLMTGIFDARLQLNEREIFWHGGPVLSLPQQMKRLGYTSIYWYGGNATNGNFDKYAPGIGFSKVMSATEFCSPDAPRTWVGVYDHIFLEEAAKRIEAMDDAPRLHFIYTTTNHGPYTVPVEAFGYDADKVMPDIPKVVRKDRARQKELGTYWYTDRTVTRFIERMRADYPDALFIVTGDHSHMPIRPGATLSRQDVSLHETYCTSFAMHHCEIDQSLFRGNALGSHMHILPTLMELIAPKGFSYASLFPSLMTPIDHIVTPYHWMTKDAIGPMDDAVYQPLAAGSEPVLTAELPEKKIPFLDELEGYTSVTAWLLRHPERLKSCW